MRHDNLSCISCGAPLAHFEEQLKCTACSSNYPLLDQIPLFGDNEEVQQWTRYHANPENARHIASGEYVSEVPAPHNAYYSRFIPKGAAKVLDAGGGDGNTTSDWAERYPQAEVYVMDLSLHGLKKVLRRQLPNMKPICAAADRRFPFPDAYFDVVSSVFMVEHLAPDALARFYREARRVLKPGGNLIVASDTRFYDAVLHPLERFIRNGKYVKNDPTHINLMTPIECETGIAAAGFELVDRTIHWVAGRHAFMRGFYRFLPARFAEAGFSTMYVVTAIKSNAT